MGFRFHKRIKIAKGLRLNLSKSGLGLTVGPRGTTIGLSSKGMYGNLSLSGTGLSYRQKINTTPSEELSSEESSSTFSSDSNNNEISVSISIDTDTGIETVTLKDSSNNVVNDDSRLRRIKRMDIYKQQLEQVRKKAYYNAIEKKENLLNIFKKCPQLVSIEETQNLIDILPTQIYQAQQYSKLKPTENEVLHNLTIDSFKVIRTWKFWKKKQLRKEWIELNLQQKIKEANNLWEIEYNKFNKQEAELVEESEKNVNEKLKYLYNVLECSQEFVENTLEESLSEINLPVQFSIDFKVSEKTVYLDIDLPEIEDYPTTYTSTLQTGKLSIKKLNALQIKENYARSIVGMTYFFAGKVFNISPKINNVIIAGYTQRINPKSGLTEDQYVYNINFERNNFIKLNVQNINPIDALSNFEHTIDISKQFDLKTI